MKKLLLIILGVATLSLAASEKEFLGFGTLPSPTGEVERYQIISAMLNDGGGDNATVIRLDKFTGKAWRLNPLPIAKGTTATIHLWVPLYEFDAEFPTRVRSEMAQ